MKFSLHWLDDYVTVKRSPKELAEAILTHSFEVDEVEMMGEGLDGVVVGRVESVEKHADADRLSVCQVDVGGEKLQQIVCGAPNVAAGQLVAVAMPGVVLPGDFAIGEREVRGVLSSGMICAEDELGLSDDHEGIMVLPVEAAPGTPLVEAMSHLDDAVMDVSVNSNRPDALSYVGFAREIAAIEGGQVREPAMLSDEELDGVSSAGDLDVKVEASELCSRFEALVIEGLEVRESPEWLKVRLRAQGKSPKNNLIDATNYVLLELGQPTHAFDADRLTGGLVVRTVGADDEIETLDDEVRELSESMLVIADGDGPVSVAGVMGGKRSAVSGSTTRMVLEAAHFSPESVRRTSREMGVRTDASGLFEKNLDAHGARRAIRRIVQILRETCPDLKLVQYVTAGELPESEREIVLALDDIEKLLGVDVSAVDVEARLGALGFGVEVDGRDVVVRVPSFRQDVVAAHDVIEEVARMIGYDHIDPAPIASSVELPRRSPVMELVRESEDVLASLGYSEVRTKSFVGEDDAQRVGLGGDSHFEVANPVSPGEKWMRRSMMESVGRVIEANGKLADQAAWFEHGHVYFPDGQTALGVREERRLMVGRIGVGEMGDVVAQVRADVDVLLSRLDVDMDGVAVQPLASADLSGDVSGLRAAFHPNAAFELSGDGDVIGIGGVVHPGVATDLGVDDGRFVVVLELFVDELVSERVGAAQFEAPSEYPASSLDVSFVVDARLTVGDLVQTMENEGGGLLARVELVDVYEGAPIEEGMKSVSLRCVYQVGDRTLTDEEVKGAHATVLRAVDREFGGKVRT